MMDLSTYSAYLGTFIAFGASKRKSDETAAALAVRELRNDNEASEAFNTFLGNAGLEVMASRNGNVLRVYASDSTSPFSFDSEDFKRAGKTQERDLLGFATLCVIASFYPTRSALNQGVPIEVTVENVISMINSMIAHAEGAAGHRGQDTLPKLADRFKVLSDDVGGPKDKGCKATYVNRVLAMLCDDNLVTAIDGKRYYLPTEALKLLAVQRIKKLTSTLGRILSDYYKQNEEEQIAGETA